MKKTIVLATVLTLGANVAVASDNKELEIKQTSVFAASAITGAEDCGVRPYNLRGLEFSKHTPCWIPAFAGMTERAGMADRAGVTSGDRSDANQEAPRKTSTPSPHPN
jgi:hypothetical protein